MLWPSSNLAVDGVEFFFFFFTPEILKFSEIIHNKCIFLVCIFLNFCLCLCLSVEKKVVVVGVARGGVLTIAGSVMVTFVSPGRAAGVLFTSVTFSSQS